MNKPVNICDEYLKSDVHAMEKELTALRAVAERHDWHPEMGQCVCDAHKAWRELEK